MCTHLTIIITINKTYLIITILFDKASFYLISKHLNQPVQDFIIDFLWNLK